MGGIDPLPQKVVKSRDRQADKVRCDTGLLYVYHHLRHKHLGILFALTISIEFNHRIDIAVAPYRTETGQGIQSTIGWT
jgi:hypothetical protein